MSNILIPRAKSLEIGNWQANPADLTYLTALKKAYLVATPRKVRNGYTIAAFNHQMKFDLQEGFPLLSTKEIKFELVIGELLWFLEGGRKTESRLSLSRLNEIDGKAHDAWNIWTPDQKRFADMGKAKFPGDCGLIYGSQWRNWSGTDQIWQLLKNLEKEPNGRYSVVNAWNTEKLDDMCLAPCHMMFQCFVRKDMSGYRYLDLSMIQRSADLFLGVPFNIASYALLTHMLAQVLGMRPGILSMTLHDYHIYLPNPDSGFEGHIKQCELQMSRDALSTRAKLILPNSCYIDGFLAPYMADRSCIRVEGYGHHPFIPAKMAY